MSVHPVDARSPIITRSVYSVVMHVGVVAAPAIPEIGRNIASRHGDGRMIDAGEAGCIINTAGGGRQGGHD